MRNPCCWRRSGVTALRLANARRQHESQLTTQRTELEARAAEEGAAAALREAAALAAMRAEVEGAEAENVRQRRAHDDASAADASELADARHQHESQLADSSAALESERKAHGLLLSVRCNAVSQLLAVTKEKLHVEEDK